MFLPPSRFAARRALASLLPALFLSLTLAGSTAAAEPAAAGDTLLVLDASGSMWGQLQGRAKIEIAREAVAAMTRTLPADARWGLMAYGHRRKGDCADIELLLPVDGGNRAALPAKAASLQPKGMTPITAAVRQAAAALRSTEQKATVILVSDGEETCNADPCALGKELEAAGVDFTAHVIGFDLPPGPARAQLHCLASSTGGRYLEAGDAASLNQALYSVAAAAPVEARTDNAWIPDVNLASLAREVVDAEADTENLGHRDLTTDQTARDCQALCAAQPACVAWTYEPTGSFFIDHPRCALKGAQFGLSRDPQTPGDGWVSGVKPGAKVILVAPDAGAD